jgi:hypothetical protein
VLHATLLPKQEANEPTCIQSWVDPGRLKTRSLALTRDRTTIRNSPSPDPRPITTPSSLGTVQRKACTCQLSHRQSLFLLRSTHSINGLTPSNSVQLCPREHTDSYLVAILETTNQYYTPFSFLTVGREREELQVELKTQHRVLVINI